MKPVTTRTLDWIADAPVSQTRTRTINASADTVWAVIADHAAWPEWFSGVSKVVPGDPAEGVGGTRTVHVPGAAVEEQFLAWTPGEQFAFTVTAMSRPIARSLVENVEIRAEGEGRCTVSYTMALDPKGPGLLAKVVAPGVGKALERGLAGLASQAEGRG